MPAAAEERGDVFGASLPDRRDRHQPEPAVQRPHEDHRPVRRLRAGHQPHRLQLPAAEDRRAGRARLPRLRRQGPQLRRLQAGQADAQRDLRAGRRQEVRHLRCHQQFRPVPRRRRQPRQPPGLLGRPFLPRGLYVPGAAARHARHRQGQRHRLLLADLLHLPDAHRQPHHAVDRAHRRRRRARGSARRRTRRSSAGQSFQRRVLDVAPLCPAGHLPHMGGDRQFRRLAQSCNVDDWRKPSGRPISPPVGEMSGRTEGGAKERKPFIYQVFLTACRLPAPPSPHRWYPNALPRGSAGRSSPRNAPTNPCACRRTGSTRRH